MKHADLPSGNCIFHLPLRHHGHGRYYTLAFLLWLLASSAAFVFVLRSSVVHSESEFREYTASLHNHLRDKLRANEAVLYGFAGFLGAIGVNSNDGARNSAKIYANSILERYPHIHMLEIVHKLARSEVDNYSAQLRRTVLPNFQIRQFGYNNDRQWRALPEKDFYYPVVFMAPELPEAAGIYGLDIDSLEGLKHALLRSEKEGVAVSSEPFRLVEGDIAYIMFRPAINSFSASTQRQKTASADISYALLVVRTLDLLPPRDTLSSKVRHASLHHDETGQRGLPVFDIADTPASRLESFLLPRLRAEHSVGDISQPLRLSLERQLRFSDINLPALALAGMASILSCAMLLAFLRSHDRQRRAFDEGRRAIEHMALHDSLTALPNRFLMLGHLEQAISLALRHDMKVAVLFLDLDGFKPINDRLGHPAGDIVLQEVARRLQTCVRDCDTASRYGGDEFVILLTEIWGEENAALVADKVLEAIRQPIQIGAESVQVGTSIGIAIFPEHGKDADTLIEKADQAMYVAKQNGSGQFAFPGIDPSLDILSYKKITGDNKASDAATTAG
jgi:diguanylate cyclase (GGDEF)-like protein